MMKTLVIVFCILSFVKEYCCFDREIHCDLNPGCTECNSRNITLFYVQAIGEKDVIHNVWDFTHGKPSFLFAITDSNSSLSVGWDNVSMQSITFSVKPKYSFGLIINKIWEFNDVNDTGTFNPSNKSLSRVFNLTDVTWDRFAIVAKEDEALVGVKSKMYSAKRNGTIKIQLNLFPYISYGFELPHLIHSANSSLIDIELENMTTSEDYNQSRFALELLLVSTEEKKDDSIDINIRKGLDDEHTPGIFEIIELITPASERNGDGGFVQFRPVSYVEKLRDVSTSTPIHMSDMTVGDIEKGSTAEIFYNNFNGHLLTETLYISFGGKGDGYYERSKYNIWSLTMGYGYPPLESFSLFVILIISIGLGIPVFLMLAGGIYVCCKRRNRRYNEPEILIED